MKTSINLLIQFKKHDDKEKLNSHISSMLKRLPPRDLNEYEGRLSSWDYKSWEYNEYKNQLSYLKTNIDTDSYSYISFSKVLDWMEEIGFAVDVILTTTKEYSGESSISYEVLNKDQRLSFPNQDEFFMYLMTK